MKIAVIQSDIIWGDIAGNIAAARSMMDREPDADLYVLPEMFTTGFNSNCETRLRKAWPSCRKKRRGGIVRWPAALPSAWKTG